MQIVSNNDYTVTCTWSV